MKCLELINVRKSFATGFFQKKREVLHGISFALEEGRTTGFVGVNGSGKTTSLKCALGFLFPDSGTIHFFGKELDNVAKARLGFLPERPYFDEFLTAREFLFYHWNLSGGGSGFEAACKRVLEKVNLSHVQERKLKTFSKGMLQRIGMAQSILRDPDLLILDEPMSGLDPDGRFLIKEIIRGQQKQGKTIFFSSHLLSDMEELCDDLVVIDQGKMLYQGALKEFLGSQGQGLEKTFQEFKVGKRTT